MSIRCPLCERELGTINVDEHHLVPKQYRGKIKHKVHRICHVKIHATFTEKDLFQYYHTWDRLREHYEIQKFVKWVSKKTAEFYDNSKWSKQKRGKKR